MHNIKFICYFLFVSARMFCVGKNYKNYNMYRVIPVNERQIEFFLNLNDSYDINFWREPGTLNYPIDFVISPTARHRFLKEAENLGMRYTKVIDDVQRVFDEQVVTSYAKSRVGTINWYDYFRLDDIYSWLTELSVSYPKEVEVKTIGKTYENRQILAVKVVLQGSRMRSTVMIEGGIHAREWISPAFVTYLINSIVHSQTSDDTTLKDVALTYEWYFVPVLNPDGYEYTYQFDRLWRKNRNGYGVDLNRNFPHAHGTVGISWHPTSEVYCGPKALSERESIAMARLIRSKNSTLEYYISFHSYGQNIVISYGTSKRHLDNYDEVYKMCKTSARRIMAKYKTRYSYGTVHETVGYMASGASSCWVKKNFNVPYVVSFELRDNGFEGFALRPNKILPTCQETLDGLISFLIPRNKNFTKLKRTDSGALSKMLDRIVIAIYVIMLII